MFKRLLILLAIILAAGVGLTAYAFFEARRDPVVRQARVVLPDWPAGVAPLRIVLLSDIHAGGLATPPERLERIVAQVNALRPDLVLLAGDFMPGHAPIDAATTTAALAPLKALRAPLGVLAVPGNHDHWTGLREVTAALESSGIRVLVNEAVVRGVLVIGGVDDDYTHHSRTAEVVAAMRRLPGPRLVFTHSPDIAPQLPADFALLLAGHTHCGQAVIPFYGSLDPVSRYQDRYRCGIIHDGVLTVIVTGGTGGSLPLRFNAPPDLWLVSVGGK